MHYVKVMAYGNLDVDVPVHAIYRLERGFPYIRAGNSVVAIPQFKAANIFSHVAQNAPAPFATTITDTLVRSPAKGRFR